MIGRKLFMWLLAGFWVGMAAGAYAAVSQLWGQVGERWKSDSRLPDFSFAGYRAGRAPIPDGPVRASVKDFGAVGDGQADDTEAFRKALEALAEGVLLIPKGRYKLTGQLTIAKPKLVLRGEGQGVTVLYFPHPLTQAVGEGKTHAPGGSWSWSGGLLAFQGWDEGEALAKIIEPAKRGDRVLILDSAPPLSPGQWVRVVLTETDGSLTRHLHGEQPQTAAPWKDHKLVDFASPVQAIDGTRVTLARPLRTDVRPAWQPMLHARRPSVHDVGLEHLTIEFPETPYVGHHQEPGYNAISFEGVSDGWVRQVEIVNADSGLFFRGESKFCTAESIRFRAGPARLRTGYGQDPGEPQDVAIGGHHGVVAMNLAQDNRVSDFQMDFRFIHDLSVAAYAVGNVFNRGKAVDMNFDHHRRAPYENLFSDIQAGEGWRLWQSGGDADAGPPSGARETFWNIRTRRAQAPPPWGLWTAVIGITAGSARPSPGSTTWWEPLAPGKLTPPDLYEAQRKARPRSENASRG